MGRCSRTPSIVDPEIQPSYRYVVLSDTLQDIMGINVSVIVGLTSDNVIRAEVYSLAGSRKHIDRCLLHPQSR